MKKAIAFLVVLLTINMVIPVLQTVPTTTSNDSQIGIVDDTNIPSVTPGSDVHVVRVSDDTTTSAEYPDTHIVDSGLLSCGRDQTGDTARIWMKFDLSHIPRNAHFTRATLNLFLVNGGSTLDEPLGLYYSNNDTWTEDTLTHNTSPDFNPVPLDVIDSPLDPGMFINQNWYEWEITSEVQQDFDENRVLTFMLTRVDETSIETSVKQFRSKDGSISNNENQIPSIAFEYEIPVTSGLAVDGFLSSPQIDYIKNMNPELSWISSDADLNDYQKNFEVEVWNSSSYDGTLLGQENNSIISVVHDTAGSGSAPSGIFSANNEIRDQYKWPASMIPDSGIVDKLYFEVDQETGLTVYNDLAIYMICVVVEDLTTVFEDNYDGRTPIQVLNRSSYTAIIEDGYVIFDIENLFVIQSNMNLIIELRHTGSSGTNIDGVATVGDGSLCTTTEFTGAYAYALGGVIDTWTQGLKLELVSEEVLRNGVSTDSFPFNHAPGFSLRVQFKYNQSLISDVGIIDRILFPTTGFEDVTFLNFRVYLVETPVEGELSHTDMDSNYGGQTPVLVLDQSQYTVQNFGKMMVIDVNNTFSYSGSNDLLIELRFSNRISGSQLVRTGINRGVYRAWDTYIDGHDTLGPDLILDFSYDATSSTYAGTPLVNGTRYYWRAKTCDSLGVWSPWETATFKYEILTSLPTYSNFMESADPLEFGWELTVSIDVTHSSGITSVQIEFDGANHTMSNEGDMYYCTWVPSSVGNIPYTLYMESQSGTWNTLSDSVLVVDTTAPSWVSMPIDQVLYLGESLSYQLAATDLSGISSWTIDDEINFQIEDGLITNRVELALGAYELKITAMDTEGNSVSSTIRIAVVSPPTSTTTTTTTTGTPTSTTNSTTTSEQPIPVDLSGLVIAALLGVIVLLVVFIIIQNRRS